LFGASQGSRGRAVGLFGVDLLDPAAGVHAAIPVGQVGRAWLGSEPLRVLVPAHGLTASWQGFPGPTCTRLVGADLMCFLAMIVFFCMLIEFPTIPQYTEYHPPPLDPLLSHGLRPADIRVPLAFFTPSPFGSA